MTATVGYTGSLKTIIDGKAPLASPAFTGAPTIGGTAVAKTTDITAAISNLVGGASAALDTLQEIDAQLAADEGSAAALAATVAGKEPAGLSTATQASLAGNYLPARGLGPRIVWLGDSITQGATDNTNQSIGQSYPFAAQLALAGKGVTVRNAGNAGDTSANVLARFDTDVTPYTPTVVPLLVGTNDVGNGVTLAAFQGNVTAIVAKIRAIGATPVLATIPPNNATTRIQALALFNLWLARYAATLGAPLIDLHRVLTNPATGTYAANLTDDGTHPSIAGQNLMGAAAAAVLSAYLRPWSPPLVHENTDTVQILGSNPLFINDGNGDGCPDNWNHYGDTAAAVSLVTDANVSGKMVRITATGATGVHIVENYISSGYSVGDKLMLAGVITSDGGIQTQLKLDFQSSGKNAFVVNATPTTSRGIFYGEFIVPPGTGAIGFQIISGAGTGYIQVGQYTVYNLTALGLA